MAYLAIIIDDIGHSTASGRRAINLPALLTYAVIPGATHATPLARYAHEAGKEVMVHMPMENLHHRPLGSLALTGQLSSDDFTRTFNQAVGHVPYAIGINNHMGSALTQEPQAMNLLMSLVKQHGMYFVDSRTTPKTVASDVARRESILSGSRDVFLDNERTAFAIDRQFRQLIRTAKQKGSAIGIGHPHQSTLDYLEMALPMLEEQNVRVLPVSRMLMMRENARQIAAAGPGGDQPGV